MRNRKSFIQSLEMLDFPNCINLTEHGRCGKFGISKCEGKECAFMKTKEEEAISKQRWAQRLSSLDQEEQNKIAKKYYGGNMAWKVNTKEVT